MTFRGQMHHRVRLMLGNGGTDADEVADILLQQRAAGVVERILQRVLQGGIGHLADIDDLMSLLPDCPPHHCRANETAAAGKKHFHKCILKTRDL